jgi:hypothetical protein
MAKELTILPTATPQPGADLSPAQCFGHSGTLLKSLLRLMQLLLISVLDEVSTVLRKGDCRFPAVVDELQEVCFFDFDVVSKLLA